ncbi:hypothetical protein Mapa_006631 [Marchantia paleacea]|nr:hypothetical protein Mapa_006631 [Marchantia paleacea]
MERSRNISYRGLDANGAEDTRNHALDMIIYYGVRKTSHLNVMNAVCAPPSALVLIAYPLIILKVPVPPTTVHSFDGASETQSLKTTRVPFHSFVCRVNNLYRAKVLSCLLG